MQEDIFNQQPYGGVPHVKGSETSRAAAEAKADAGTLRGWVYRFVKGRGQDGATDHEIDQSLGRELYTLRPRRVELVKLGMLKDSGRTRTTKTGRQATVWVAV